MPSRFSQLIAAGVLGVLMLAVIDFGTAQDPKPIPLVPPGGAPQPDPNAPPDGAEVLARGPVHEAFATTAEAPTPEPVIAKQPPEPIEELPPDQKPEGDNVQWISGYWDWDEENERFFWLSGCWRDTPPGRLWVPGSWRQVVGGWQWVSGFWQEPQVEEPAQPQLTYLPEPPQTLEVGPTVAAPTTTSFYVPGSWVWRQKYVWRPGVWVEYRPNWIWVPAHFRWTPLGHVFVDGYWDYTLASRGVLFAPIVFTRPIRPQFVYTPVYVVSEPALVGALFVRRGRPTYYFGDYFEPRYVNRGFNPWAGRVTGTTFAVGFGTGRTWGYDPLWSHYAVAYRTDPVWNTRVNTLYTGRYTGNVARPPVTLVQQNTAINKITNVNVTNVTNNITVVNNATNNTRQVTVNNQNVTDVAMIAPVSASAKLQPEARIKTVTAEVRQAEARSANQTREVGVQRNRAETAAVAKLPPMPKANPKADPKQPNPPPAAVQQPQTLKLEVPKAAVTRAQISKDEKKAPPPPAIKTDAKVDPKGTPKVDPKGTPDPKGKVDPKPDPKTMPDPKGKVDPKPKDPTPDPKVEPKPKVDPKPDPKAEPKPKIDPKVEPKPKTEPKVEPKPKDPVPVPMPKTEPKVEPKKVEPIPDPKPKVEPKKVEPVPLPKVEPKPKDPVTPVPVPMPKVEPKKVDPPPVPLPTPKVEPKKEPAPAPKPKDPAPIPVPVPPAPKVEPKAPAPPPVPPTPKVEPKAPAPAPVTPPAPKAEPKKGEPKKGNEPKKDPTP